MKRKLFYTLMITSLLLSACGNSTSSDDEPSTTISNDISQSPDDEPSTEDNQTPQKQESETLEAHSDVSTFKSLDELETQAKDLAASSEKITEGKLYDSITAIYPDVTIRTDADNNLSIRINLAHDTIEDDSLVFFETVISICESCSLENYSSNISFIMMVDGEFVTMISMLDYTSLNSFSSTPPVVLVDEYESVINDIYSTLFSTNDVTN
jgi:hypothetical protein